MNYLSYIKGVLDGDGYINWGNKNPRICLDTKSEDFILKFIDALNRVDINTPKIVRRTRYREFNGYSFIAHHLIIQTTCDLTFLKSIKELKFCTKEDKLSYLQGIFDSEGSLCIKEYTKRTCYNWRITNSNLSILNFIKTIISELGIKTTLRNYDYHVPFIDIQNRQDIERIMEALKK